MAKHEPIPGIPGAADPTFCTRDRRFLSLDRVVHELCDLMEDDGTPISPRVAKAAVQSGRQIVCRYDGLCADELATRVSLELRRARVLLTPTLVERLLVTYGRLVIELDITSITDTLAAGSAGR